MAKAKMQRAAAAGVDNDRAFSIYVALLKTDPRGDLVELAGRARLAAACWELGPAAGDPDPDPASAE